MKIGFDIDDVIYDMNTNLLKYINKKNNKNHKLDDIKDWNIALHLWISFDEVIEHIHGSKVYVNSKLSKDFIAIYNELKKNWYEITFISSRLDLSSKWFNTAVETIKWLRSNGIQDEIVITNTKWLEVQKRWLKYFVDDGLHNIHDIKEYNKDIKLFVLDKPWNQKQEMKRLETKWKIINETHFIRIKNVKDIKKYISF